MPSLRPGGYAAGLLLDGRILAGRASLRAAEEALRRWLNAAALVRPAAEGGRVVVVADSSLAAVQALIRWDPVRHSERESAEREQLRFPPSVRMAAAAGPQAAVAELMDAVRVPPGADVLGPVPSGDGAPESDGADAGLVRVFLRVPRSRGADLAARPAGGSGGAQLAEGRRDRSGANGSAGPYLTDHRVVCRWQHHAPDAVWCMGGYLAKDRSRHPPPARGAARPPG